MNDLQGRPHGALGVFFVRGGPAEIGQDAITHVAGDKPVVARDHIAAEGSIRVQQAAQFFGVELFTQRRRTHQVAEHHGELAAFAGSCCHVGCSDGAVRIRFDIGCGRQLGDRIAYAQPVAGTRHADVLQHLVIDTLSRSISTSFASKASAYWPRPIPASHVRTSLMT